MQETEEMQVQPLGREDPLEKGNPLKYACLENPTDRGAWRTTVRGVTESDTTEVTERAVNLLRLFHLEHFSKDGTCTKFYTHWSI